QCIRGTNSEQRNPTAMPPSVISSGMMKCSKSMNNAAIKPPRNTQHTSASPADRWPNDSQLPRNNTPVSNSTRKYRGEMGARQLAHLPRSQSHVTSGMFRYQGIE